jgi:nucleoside-diphosphate-sugar epimerase
MILVTGGTGFLGKEVVRLLISKYKKKVRCIVRPTGSYNFLESIFEKNILANMDIFPASFNDISSLRIAVKGVDVVIHLAASLTGSVSAQVSNTVVGSENLFKVCIEEGINRFVLCSSFSVFGASQVPRNDLIDETIPMEKNPEKRDPYSFTKHMQEQLAWQYFNCNKLPLVVVRPGVVYGPPLTILSSRIGINLFGLFLHLGGKNLIPLTYKDNCADLIIRAGLISGIEGEIFCAVDDDLPESAYLLSRYKNDIDKIFSIRIPYIFLKLLAKLNVFYSDYTKGHLPSIFTPYKVDAIWKGHKFSNKKAKDKLQWKPLVSMQDGLQRTYDYMKYRK